jgi:1-acyl-sn-glycerol-3-phosphate acyltransferase
MSLGFHLIGGVTMSGCENLPVKGGGLLLSNHLSYLDVIAIGLAVPRQLRYVARSSLFVPVLGPFIRSVGGFPIDREGGGVAGLKETLRRLRAGQIVLIFPEGTRSPDGEIQELKPGVAALARSGVPFYPAAVAGTFESLPRGRILPRWHPIHVHFGPPIPPEALAGLTPEALTSLVHERLRECQAVARDGATRGLWSRDRYGDD